MPATPPHRRKWMAAAQKASNAHFVAILTKRGANHVIKAVIDVRIQFCVKGIQFCVKNRCK